MASPYALAWGTGGNTGGPAPVALPEAPVGSSPYASAWGSATPQSAAQAPIAAATGALGSEYAKVWGTGDVSGQNAANAAVTSKGHNNVLTNIFHAIDAPRAAVLATGRQLEHVATGGSWNQAQLHSDAVNHTGVADLLKSAGMKGGWPNKALGFVGDVATDPITYLTLGTGDAAEMGAKGIAEQIVKGADEGGSALTNESLANFLAKGSAGLNAEEKAALAERGTRVGGAYMRVPLTKLAQHLNIMDAKYIPILPSEITDTLTGPAREIYNALSDTKVGQAITGALSKTGGLRAAVREAAMGGDAQGTRDAWNVLQAAPKLKTAASAFVAEHVPGLVKSLGQFDPETHGADLVNALEHSPDSTEHVAALENLAKNGLANPGDAVAGVRNWLDTVKSAAAQHGVSVAQLEDYFPHQLTDEAKAAGLATGRVGAGQIAPEFRRTIDGTVQDINDARSVPLFKDSAHEVLPKYLQQMGRRVGQADFLQTLKDAGTVSDRYVPKDLVDKASGLIDHVPAQQMYEAAQQSGQDLYSKLQDLGGPAATDEHEQAFKDLTTQASNTEAQLKAQGSPMNDTALKQTLTADPKAQAVFADMLKPGNAELMGTLASLSDKAQQAPSWMNEALDQLTAVQKPGGINTFLRKYYDPQLRLWKAYSLMTPGKALRHQFGAMFNMFLANTLLHNTSDAFSMLKDYHGGGLEALDEGDRAIVKGALDNGVFHNSQFTEDEQQLVGGPKKTFGIGEGRSVAAGKFNPINSDNVALKFNRDLQTKAQDYMRFSVFHDAMAKGATAGEAADKVRTFLFDWGDHTNFEQNVLKRLIPFYTFTRQNVPLMLHQMALQPGKFTTFYHLGQNIEKGVAPDALEPQFFKDAMAVHLPFKSGGNSTYLRPDLPFTRLGETLNGVNSLLHGNPDWLMSQTTPLLKTPIEEWAGKSFYTNAKFAGTDASTGPHVQAVPGTWTKIPGLMEALQAGGIAHRAVQPFVGTNRATIGAGQWAMTPAAIYGLESLVPGLGQLRRTLPTEPNMMSRGGTNKLAYFLGQNFSTNDPTQQAGDIWNKYDTLQRIYNSLQDRGLAPQKKYPTP